MDHDRQHSPLFSVHAYSGADYDGSDVDLAVAARLPIVLGDGSPTGLKPFATVRTESLYIAESRTTTTAK
jgi:hypothetical protein